MTSRAHANPGILPPVDAGVRGSLPCSDRNCTVSSANNVSNYTHVYKVSLETQARHGMGGRWTMRPRATSGRSAQNLASGTAAVAHPRPSSALSEVVSTTPYANRYGLILFLGYGLFKALMDLTYTTAASTIENSYIIINNLSFSILSSFFIIPTAGFLAIYGWKRPHARLDAAAVVALVCLAAINLFSVMGLLSVFPPRMAGIFLAAVYGVTAITANTAWLAPFAALRPRRCLTFLSLGMLIGSSGTALVGQLPAATQPWCLLGLGVASAVLYVLHMHYRQLLQEMYQDWSVRESHGEQVSGPSKPIGKTEVVDAIAYLGSPFSVYAVLGFILSLVTAFQVSGNQAVNGSSSLRDTAAIATYVLVVCFALFARSMPSIRKTFGRVCPIIALILVVMPFVDSTGGAIFTSVIAAFNAFANASMLFLLLEYSYAHKLPVRSAVTAVTFLSRLIVLFGLIAGAFLGAQHSIDATVRALVVALASIYLLMLILITFARSKRKAYKSDSVSLSSQKAEASAFDLSSDLDVAPSEAAAAAASAGAGTAGAASAGEAEDPAETYETCARELGERYQLTQREQDVLLLLARGRSAAYIATELGLATSTVRGYVKSIYTKLDVHSKQELIDLFSSDSAQ